MKTSQHSSTYDQPTARFRIALIVLVVFALLGAACSGSSDSTETSTGDSTPTATATEPLPEEPTADPTEAPAPTTEATAVPTETSEPTPPNVDDAPTLDLTQILTDQVGNKDGGIVALATRDGVTSSAAAGNADPTTALETDAIFRAGSISKTFVSAMVLQQVDEGNVDLDATLATYLPDTPIGGDVTVRQLLSHRSGIPSYTSQQSFFPSVLGDPAQSFEPADIIEFVVGVDGQPAGDRFEYSNTNYVLLGQLIEALDQRPLEESLQVRIAGPAGLTNTSFEDPSGLAGGWSEGLQEGEPVEYEAIRSSAWAAGALTTTVDDLALFLDALFSGELTSQESLEEMQTMNDGYGLGLMELGFGIGVVAYGHGGSIPGFQSIMAHDPNTGDTVVVLANNDIIDPNAAAVAIIQAW